MNLFKLVWKDESTTYSRFIEANDLTTAITIGRTDSFTKDHKLVGIEQVFVSPKQYINKPRQDYDNNRRQDYNYRR